MVDAAIIWVYDSKVTCHMSHMFLFLGIVTHDMYFRDLEFWNGWGGRAGLVVGQPSTGDR